MNEKKLIKLLDEIVYAIIYQQGYPTEYKQDLVNAFNDFKLLRKERKSPQEPQLRCESCGQFTSNPTVERVYSGFGCDDYIYCKKCSSSQEPKEGNE